MIVQRSTTQLETKMETKIYITVKQQYGRTVAYPACRQSGLLAELAGTRTLTAEALTLIEGLGFEIHYQPQALPGFQPARVSVDDLREVLS